MRGAEMGGRLIPSFAIALGVVMPLVSAAAYPTYFTEMAQPWLETTRIIELPYVLFELCFILWAGRRGFDVATSLKALPPDVRLVGVVWVVAMFASSILLSNDVSYALTHSLLWIVHAIFALAVVRLLGSADWRDSDRFLGWHGIGLGVLTLYTAFWFLTVPPAETLPFGEIRLRGAVPGWIDVRHFGSWTGAIAAGLAVRILYGEADRGLGWMRVLYALAAGLTVWTGTRAAILAIIVAVLVIVVVRRGLPEWKRIAWAALLTASACGLAFLLVPEDPVFWMFANTEAEAAGGFAQNRLGMWGHAVNIWLRSPWLGLGTGSIFWEYPLEARPTQPHNVVLQFLISWGVVGAAAGLWIVLRALRATHRAGRSYPASLPLMAMLYALLFQSLLEGMLHYPRFIVSIVVLSAIVHAGGRDRTSETDRS